MNNCDGMHGCVCNVEKGNDESSDRGREKKRDSSSAVQCDVLVLRCIYIYTCASSMALSVSTGSSASREPCNKI